MDIEKKTSSENHLRYNQRLSILWQQVDGRFFSTFISSRIIMITDEAIDLKSILSESALRYFSGFYN